MTKGMELEAVQIILFTLQTNSSNSFAVRPLRYPHARELFKQLPRLTFVHQLNLW
jgi:hypothetical protein